MIDTNHPLVPYRLVTPLRRTANAELDRRDFLISKTALVSFPKCGRTWLRVVLGKIIYDHFHLDDDNYLFLTTEQLELVGLERIYITHDGIDSWYPMRTIISKDKTKYRNHRVIFLTRDIRAIVTSYFYHIKYRYGIFHDDISVFLRSPWGIETILKFHKSWYDNQATPLEFLLIKYEDMHQDLETVIRQILSLLEINNISDVTISNAIEFGRLRNLKTLVQTDSYPAKELSSNPQLGANAMKIRQGQVKGFLNDLTEADVKYIEQRLADYPELTTWLWNT